jgi:inner membrane protein
LVWRTQYLFAGQIYVDAIRAGFLETKIYEGSSVPFFDLASVRLPDASPLKKDLQIFEWFADGWLSSPAVGQVVDMRYGALPNSVQSFWGIHFELTKPEEHVTRVGSRDIRSRQFSTLWSMVLGR